MLENLIGLDKFICPYCLNEIRTNELIAKCNDCGTELSRKEKKCPKCVNSAILYHCPKCKNELPYDYAGGKNIMISVVGPKASGKSHYIAVLIDCLKKSFAREFGSSLRSMDDTTRTTYNNAFWTPLFSNHQAIASTVSASANNTDLVPLIYLMKIGRHTITFVFFDSAGEDLKREETIKKYNRYIAMSSGIVFLVDPLQVPYIYDRIKSDSKPSRSGNQEIDVYENVINAINSIARIKQSDKLDIPIAITLTKSDLLIRDPQPGEDPEVFLGRDSAVDVPRKTGGYDSENFEQINMELENYLDIVTQGQMTSLTKTSFQKYKYFAVSSLGGDPGAGGSIRTLAPKRVEDPIIWLLYESRVIRKV